MKRTSTQKKPKTHGGARPGSGQPKGPEKRLVSGRIELDIFERLETEAVFRGRSVSAQVAQVLTERYSPFPEDVSEDTE